MWGISKKREMVLLNTCAASANGGGGKTRHTASMKMVWQMRLRINDQSIDEFSEGDGTSVPKESIGGIRGSGMS